jgi:hypothetical protein
MSVNGAVNISAAAGSVQRGQTSQKRSSDTGSNSLSTKMMSSGAKQYNSMRASSTDRVAQRKKKPLLVTAHDLYPRLLKVA